MVLEKSAWKSIYRINEFTVADFFHDMDVGFNSAQTNKQTNLKRSAPRVSWHDGDLGLDIRALFLM